MIFFEFLLTIFGYLVFPICYRCMNDRVPLKKAKKLALINSIVCAIIFEIVQIVIFEMVGEGMYVPSFAPAFLYYSISKWILREKDSIEKTVETHRSEIAEKDDSPTIKSIQQEAEKINIISEK